MKQKENRLDAKNCNTTFCKSCVFHPNEKNRLNLTAYRVEEITGYLATLKNSHVCHVTNKTCYGGLVIQARSAFALKIIPQNSVESFLETAKSFLFKNK